MTMHQSIESTGICGKPSAWGNGGGCILTRGHPVCPESCKQNHRKQITDNSYKMLDCGWHKLADGRVWPIGHSNREYA